MHTALPGYTSGGGSDDGWILQEETQLSSKNERQVDRSAVARPEALSKPKLFPVSTVLTPVLLQIPLSLTPLSLPSAGSSLLFAKPPAPITDMPRESPAKGCPAASPIDGTLPAGTPPYPRTMPLMWLRLPGQEPVCLGSLLEPESVRDQGCRPYTARSGKVHEGSHIPRLGPSHIWEEMIMPSLATQIGRLGSTVVPHPPAFPKRRFSHVRQPPRPVPASVRSASYTVCKTPPPIRTGMGREPSRTTDRI